MSKIIKKEILALLKPEQVVYLATSCENQPSNRPVTLIYNKGRFFFATGSSDAKTEQLLSNPKIEICLPIKDEKYSGYIRFTGKAEAISDAVIRKEIYDEASFLNYFWKESTDPSYVLYRMTWQKAEYMKPGEHLTTKVDW